MHDLPKNAPLLEENITAEINSDIDSLELNAILPQQEPDDRKTIDTAIAKDSIIVTEPEPVIDELTVTKTSTTEDITSTFQVPDTAFDRELKSDRQYSASLTSDETLPDWIEIDSKTGDLTFEAEYEEVGNHQILVEVEDKFGQAASTIVDLAVKSQAGSDTLLRDDEIAVDIVFGQGDFGTIQEVAAIPQIRITDTQITDSSVGRELIFTVSLSTPSDQKITADYSTADDTAKAGKDYIAIDGTVTFEPGETEQTITVNTTGTNYLDPDKDLEINLSNSQNGSIEDNQGIGTILPAYGGIRGGSRKQETVTFSFFDEDIFGQGGYDGSNRESNAKEPSEAIKANYRQIFENLNTFVDREFVEVAESESQQGDIRIVISDGPSYAYAGGHIHLAGWAAASDAGSNGWESPPGVYAYSALMHELGHAIGMPHSFGRETSVFDPEESGANTVMSYRTPGNKAATFMSYDIKSLQERYGAGEYRSGDTVYEFVTVDNYLVDGDLAIDTTRRLKQTIWDSGGNDTFDFSGLATDDSGYRFDLNQSKYQTTQLGFEGASYDLNGTTYYVPKYGTSIAIDVEIENLINSSSDDLIIANSTANTFSGYAPGLTTGDDVLVDTDELDTLDLSEFSFFDVTQKQVEEDLEIELGLENSITIEDYFSSQEENRINILLDRIQALVDDVSIVEGNNGIKTANFGVNLSQASNEKIELDYTTVDGNAKAGEDYKAKTGKVTFNPGETSKNIAVEILGDTAGEANETFGINLLGSYAQVIGNAEGTINNDDGAVPLPTLSVSDTNATSGNHTAIASFLVSLDRSHDSQITVDYATADHVAIAEQDYEENNGTLVFAPGETEKSIEVEIIADNSLSRDEEFKLQLSNPSSNATIAENEGIGTIIDSSLKVDFPNETDKKLQLASYPPDSEKDPHNLPFEVDADHNSLSITGDGDGWKEIPLVDNLASNDSRVNPYTVVEFDFKSTEAGKLHGLHFESKDHHNFYAPWERGRFFQLYGSSEFGIQDFNNYQDSLGEWKTYQIPVGQFIDNTIFHNGNSKAVKWLAFAHEGNSDDSNSQFRNLEFKELLPISVAGVTVNESSDVATFTLTIPEASKTEISLDYATADDTAVAGQDYTAKTGTVTFAPGDISKTIAIDLNDDARSEAAESFNLNLSNVQNAIALKSELSATIEDNDEALPIISIEDVSFAEGNTGNSSASININLDQPSTKQITVKYSTEDETALSKEDYQEATGKITFAPGETNKTVDISLKGDALNESDESFWLNFADANNATIDRDRAAITISNDDALPNISIEDAGVLSSIPVKDGEGNIRNSTGLLFEVTLDRPSNQTIKVDYATEDGTAKADEDYTAKDKTLTFQPGETVKNVFVGVTLDESHVADEELNLILSNAENAAITDDRAIGTIESTRSLLGAVAHAGNPQDRAAPLAVKDLEVREDGKEALFTVSLDKPSVQGVFVNYATEDGTAKAGADYTETKGRLFIKAGETSAVVSVPIIDNKLTETDETFYLNLTKPKYVLLDGDRAEATILNDDAISSFNPGGIYQNLQLWIKSDAAVANDAQKVTKWFDNSQQGLDLAQTNVDNQPILSANALNHNSVLSFDGDDLLETVNTLPADFASNSSVFVVTKSDSKRNNFLFTLDDTGYGRFLAHMPWSNQIHFDAGNTGTGRLSIPYADSKANQFNTWHFSSDLDKGQNIFRNGLSVANDDDASTPETSDRQFQIGRQFKGDIAEVIVFNQALNQSDRHSVDSYLATKYGFTLDQTTPTDYINSDSQVIWNASEAGGYNHDITGITTDFGSGLSQPKSRSSNADSIITITAEDTVNGLEDGEALFWSNSDRGDKRDRIWQVQENQGDIGTVRVSFDLSQLGQQIPLANYALQIADNDDFNNSQLTTTGRTIENNTLTFTGIDFQNGEYFTLNTEYVEPPVGSSEPVVVVEPPSPVIESEPVVVVEPPVVESFDISSLELIKIQRFFDSETGHHIYSTNENNKELGSNSEVQYSYEGESYAVLESIDNLTGEIAEQAKPVYGFLNEDTDAQLFTMDVGEKDYIIDNFDNYQSQGVAYYAFETELEAMPLASFAITTIPVYRLLNEDTGTHLFTSDRNELNYIQDNLNNFNLENNNEPVFYALEI